KAPAAIGPYVQAVRAGGFLFLSGQVPLDPASGALLADADIAQQTERVFLNLQAVLEAGGSSLAQAVKATVYLADLNDFAAMNAAYAKFFPQNPPARSTVEVSRLPRGARVEIDLIALA
ncbi:MAG TPA: Rid family detoxifying hydrolase, partial [Terriglobales bacterium]|nr:Rid family detoxifying hydrolase [Terriglobales bacterium]